MIQLEVQVEAVNLSTDGERVRREVEPHRPTSPLETIKHGLAVFNVRVTGEPSNPLRVYLRAPADPEVHGGLLGETGRGGLHVTDLWVAEPYRRQGYGTRLLKAAEAEASRRGCRFAHVETLSFQAPEFYRKQGYQIFGTLEGFTGGHSCYYLRKEIAAA